MFRKFFICLYLLILLAGAAWAGDDAKKTKAKAKAKNADAKELSGMSIVGNDEAPKSLYIVPWKNSEIGLETALNSMLNEHEMPVDREVFSRQLEFYNVSKKK